MKTITTTIFAGMFISLALGSGTESQAADFGSLVNGAIKSVQWHGSLERNRASDRFAAKHFGNHHGHWNPRPTCTPNYCPPPPPRICYIYIVYYYDCHCGWKVYGEYHSRRAASYAVSSLQHRGYRAYYQQVAR